MNLKTALRLAKVIALSSTRSGRARSQTPRGFAKSPILNLLISVVLFPLVYLLTRSFVSRPSMDASFLALLYTQVTIFIPSFMTFLSMMYSIMFELSQSSSAASTDMLNWLPITVGEFVLGSSLTTMYFISPLVSAFLGASLALAIVTGMFSLWVLSGLLGLLGCFLGAFGLEVVRALLNRTTSALSRRAGQSVLIIRMLLSVLLFAAFYVITNVNVLTKIVGWFAGSIRGAWIVPLLWPSLSIMSHIQGDPLGTLAYSILSLLLTSSFFWLGVVLRARYWAAVPVSIRLQPVKERVRGKGLLGGLGFTSAGAALIRKDLRSLVRRREMVRLLALPVMLFLMAVINSGPNVLWDPASSFMKKLGFLIQMGMGVMFFAAYVALSAIGQEGKSFSNLQMAPLKASMVTRAKAAAALLPSMAGFAVIMALYVTFIRGEWGTAIAVAAVGVSLLLEASLLGVAAGSRFPDFREVPRARFVTFEGTILGMIAIGLAAMVTIAPIYMSEVVLSNVLSLPAATAVSLAIASTISYLGYRAAVSGIERLFTHATV